MVIILAVAMALVGALLVTTLDAASEAQEPSGILAGAEPGKSYQLTGKVKKGTVERDGNRLRFEVRDRQGQAAVPVRYQGQVPSPFREGREVLVTGTVRNGVFYGRKDTLTTKCPSKFKAQHEAGKT